MEAKPSDTEIISLLFLFSYEYSAINPYTCPYSILQERLWTMLVIIVGVAMKEILVLFLQLHLTGQLSEVKRYLSPDDI